MLRIYEVEMHFKRAQRPLFSGASLSVDDGTIAPLLGSNGAGKTTMLRIAAGLIKPHTGTVELNGVKVDTEADRAQADMGISLYPERSFYFRLTCHQNLRYFASLRGMRKKVGRDEAKRVLELVGLSECADTMFMRLSLGQRRRLGLARALMGQPSLLLLDEPTANLDSTGVEMVHSIVDAHRFRGGSVLFSTHHQQDLHLATGPIFLLRDGELREIRDDQSATGTRGVEVSFGTERPQHLATIAEYYSGTRTADGIILDVPVDVPLHQVIAEIEQLGVCISGVYDQLWQSTSEIESSHGVYPERSPAHAVP